MLKEKFDVDLLPEADQLHKIWITWMSHVVEKSTIMAHINKKKIR